MARGEQRLHVRARPGTHLDADDETDVEDRSTDAGAQPDWLRQDARESALSPFLPERWRGARLDPGRRGLAALSAVGLLVVLAAGYMVLRDSPQVSPVPPLPVVTGSDSNAEAVATRSAGVPSAGQLPTGTTVPVAAAADAAATATTTTADADIVVSVVGLVSSSGLVHLPPGSRVADALAAAGGPRVGADVLALNLAAKVSDGDQIVVGSVPPGGAPVVSGTVSNAPGSSTGTAQSATDPAVDGKVNLNDATATDLDTLPGVGPVTAGNIVSWREVNGPFTDVAQLGEVDGIGPVRLEKLREYVFV